jgi:hypothetical protein
MASLNWEGKVMVEINSGRWTPGGDGVIAQRVAAGIRCNPEAFVDDLKPEQIFVAITGREGCYRKKEDVDRILEQIGLDIAYMHDAASDEAEVDCFIWQDADEHRRIFDNLVDVVDTVYPLPEEDEQEEVDEKEEEITGF